MTSERARRGAAAAALPVAAASEVRVAVVDNEPRGPGAQGFLPALRAHLPESWRLVCFHNDPAARRAAAALRPHALVAPLLDAGMLAFAAGLGVPVVDYAATLAAHRFHAVRYDWASAGALAARHLADLGLRQAAFLGLPQRHFSRELRRGFWQELRARGLGLADFEQRYGDEPAPPALPGVPLCCGAVKAREGEPTAVLAAWLRALPRPSGLLVYNDQLAAEVIDFCSGLGLRVPGDLGVIGVGADPRGLRSLPAVSSVVLPAARLGGEIAGLLRRLVAGERVPRRWLLLPAERVLERGSTGPAGADSALAAGLRALRRGWRARDALAQALAAAHLSRRTFERRCRALLGRGPAEDLARLRLEHARELLADSALPIKEVARRAGFASRGHFSRRFRSACGMTPSRWRADQAPAAPERAEGLTSSCRGRRPGPRRPPG